jgi:hypothetical protein
MYVCMYYVCVRINRLNLLVSIHTGGSDTGYGRLGQAVRSEGRPLLVDVTICGLFIMAGHSPGFATCENEQLLVVYRIERHLY